MLYFSKRISEYFSAQLIPSVIFTYLFTNNILAQTFAACVIVMLLCIIGNAVYLIWCLKNYLHSTESYGAYYKVNLSVFLAFAALCILLAYINIEPIYTYFFMPYKLLTFFNADKVTSAIVINAVMLACIVFVPAISPLKEIDEMGIFVKEFDNFEEMDYFNNK